MGYAALYRKYRPTTFTGVIGQDHITLTLTNQIKGERVSHAYLFTGSRGTGKTSCAKIFARAVNCAASVDGSPCGKCEVCSSLDNPSNMDVVEMDAASNNGVDEIRELRENIRFMPAVGKYKVYIIDEVHMLSAGAFNALLKTLEEPPSHVIFILATTEVHKLPATILSRCMRFDFRLVSTEQLRAHIADIFTREGKEFEPEAVAYIADSAEGSVRDCLSIADKCINISDKKLTYADVLDVLGAADKSKTASLFEAIAGGDIGASLNAIDELARLGKSMQIIAKDLCKYARDLLVLKTTGERLIIDTKENIAKMNEVQKRYTPDLLITVIRQFSALDTDLRYSVSPKIVLETAAVRACRLSGEDLSALAERVRRLENDGIKVFNQTVANNGNGMNTISGTVETNGMTAATTGQSQASATQAGTMQIGGGTKPSDARSVWGRLTTYFRQKGAMGLYTLFSAHNDYEIADGRLNIYAKDERYLQLSDAGILESINEALIADGQGLKCEILKRTEAIDMDNEISNIKRLMGNAKVNVIK